jgi:hypothetical protein
MLAQIRTHLAHNVVGYIALFVALGGTSYAVATGSIDSREIKNNSIRSKDVRNATIKGTDVKDDSLDNGDIDNAGLAAQSATSSTTAKRADTAGSATSATNASNAASADNATNAGMLDGLDSTAFPRRACSSVSGAIKGFARIDTGDSFSSTFTTNGVESPYNCSGQTVEARRVMEGWYEVRFNGNTAGWALAGAHKDDDAYINVGVNVTRNSSPGVFTVTIFETSESTSFEDDYSFVILLF